MKVVPKRVLYNPIFMINKMLENVSNDDFRILSEPKKVRIVDCGFKYLYQVDCIITL